MAERLSLLEQVRRCLRLRHYSIRTVYLVRSGCAWRLLPHNLPPWKTVYHYYRLGRIDGTWERVNRIIRELLDRPPIVYCGERSFA